MKNKALENGWTGGRKRDSKGRKAREKASHKDTMDFIKEMDRLERISYFEESIEKKYVYMNPVTGGIINIENLSHYQSLLQLKAWAEINLKPVNNYPLYENQKEYKLIYLEKEFTFYIHDEEAKEIKKSIDDKKFLLDNIVGKDGIPDTKKQRRKM